MIRRIRRCCCAALLIWPALAAPPLTTIQDMLYKADGTRFNGLLTIAWTSFQAPDSSAIVTQSTTVKVLDGILHVQLVPTTTSTPPSQYTVTYNSDGRVQFQETWSVPASTRPLRVRDVRTSAGASTGSGTAGNDTGSSPVAESNVVGLIADLGARPVKSPSFAPGRTAVVDGSGLLATAAGSPADCVHVDGSSGPCGGGGSAGSFVDGDAPTGIVDGSNTTFGLAATPDPATSLAMYRNGMLQKAGQDYALSGSVVTFVAANTPQPGDTLLASYRVASSGDGGTALPAPQVLCAGLGTGTSAGTATVLGTCSIPAGLLAPGDRVELRFDYAHQGTAGGFTVEADWGATMMMRREAVAGETLVSGRAAAAILISGAQLSAESWGATLPLAVSAGSAADVYSTGLVVNLLGSTAQSGDTVTLANFTVVRIP